MHKTLEKLDLCAKNLGDKAIAVVAEKICQLFFQGWQGDPYEIRLRVINHIKQLETIDYRGNTQTVTFLCFEFVEDDFALANKIHNHFSSVLEATSIFYRLWMFFEKPIKKELAIRIIEYLNGLYDAKLGICTHPTLPCATELDSKFIDRNNIDYFGGWMRLAYINSWLSFASQCENAKLSLAQIALMIEDKSTLQKVHYE